MAIYPLQYGQATTVDAATHAAMAKLPAFLTEPQKLRLAKIKAGRSLFRGHWRRYLITEGRTAHLYKALKSASGSELPLLVTVNVLALAARKTADLLMLDPPGVSAPEGLDVQQEAIDSINRASSIETVLYEAALTSCFEAEAWLQVIAHDGRVLIRNVPADQCFPVGDPLPDGTYAAVEKVWILSRGSGQNRRDYLRKEIHAAGEITNELYALNSYGAIDGRLGLAAWYGAAAAPPERLETGVDEPLLGFVPNFQVGGETISDFDGVDELVDQFTAAVSQVARVLALHADPKMGIPESLFEEDGRFKATDEAFAFVTKEDSPFYLVWNAQLESGLKMMDRWLRWLLVVIEMSPAVLGLKEGAAPDAYKKLRLEAVNTLSKVARKKLFWTRFLAARYRVAHKLDQTMPGTRYDFDEVGIDWNDGIPLDESERIATIIEKRVAGILDRQTAVEQAEGPEAAPEINERLGQEESLKARQMMNLTEREIQ